MKHSISTYFIWLLPFIGFIGGYSIMSYIFSIQSLPTPALVGNDLHQAFKELSQSSITLRLLATKQDPDLPHGTILSQKPLPGQTIKPNQSIYIVLSSKPPAPQAPDIREQPLQTITNVCKKETIRLKPYLVDSRYPQNHCIAQYPHPHQPLPDHYMIAYISCGIPKPILWPNFKEIPLSHALEFLENHDIIPEVTRTKQVVHDDPLVRDQRPLAGSLITLDDTKPIRVQLKI